MSKCWKGLGVVILVLGIVISIALGYSLGVDGSFQFAVFFAGVLASAVGALLIYFTGSAFEMLGILYRRVCMIHEEVRKGLHITISNEEDENAEDSFKQKAGRKILKKIAEISENIKNSEH